MRLPLRLAANHSNRRRLFQLIISNAIIGASPPKTRRACLRPAPRKCSGPQALSRVSNMRPTEWPRALICVFVLQEFWKSDAIDKVVLSGGGAYIPDISAFLEKHYQTTIELSNRLQFLNMIEPFSGRLILRRFSALFTVAVGLALRKVVIIMIERIEINLLPAEYRYA